MPGINACIIPISYVILSDEPTTETDSLVSTTYNDVYNGKVDGPILIS